jgi:hypothetical protein
LNIFNVSNTDGGDNLRREEVNLFAVAHGICHAISSFVELIILLLLCTSSIGKNNFYRSWFVARYIFPLKPSPSPFIAFSLQLLGLRNLPDIVVRHPLQLW